MNIRNYHLVLLLSVILFSCVKQQPITAEKKVVNGVPELFINGKEDSRVWARLDAPHDMALEKIKQYDGAEIDFYITTSHENITVCWDGADGYDYREYEVHLQRLIENHPNIKLVLFVGIPNGAPYKWSNKYPEEMAETHTGEKIKLPSMASQQFRKDFHVALAKFIEHFEQSKFANNIIGYNLHRNCNESFGYNMTCPNADGSGGYFTDYSKPMVNHFRTWLKDHYQNDVIALQKVGKTIPLPLKMPNSYS